MPSQEEQPQLVKIAEGLYVRQEVDNIGWADMGEGILVVDALEQVHLEDEVMAMMEDSVPGKKVDTVLNTHTHYDHVALNKAFEKKHGAKIVNLQTTDVPEKGLVIAGAGRTCRFIPMPGCHTREDCIAWFAEDRTLFVGDLFGWGLITSMTSATRDVMTGLESVYNRLIDFGAETVVPGHGPLCSNAELVRCRAYYDWLAGEVYNAFDAGKKLPDIITDIPVPDDMNDWWRLCDWKHEQNIRKLFKGARRHRA